jgi:hypothetical protein
LAIPTAVVGIQVALDLPSPFQPISVIFGKSQNKNMGNALQVRNDVGTVTLI